MKIKFFFLNMNNKFITFLQIVSFLHEVHLSQLYQIYDQQQLRQYYILPAYWIENGLSRKRLNKVDVLELVARTSYSLQRTIFVKIEFNSQQPRFLIWGMCNAKFLKKSQKHSKKKSLTLNWKLRQYVRTQCLNRSQKRPFLFPNIIGNCKK